LGQYVLKQNATGKFDPRNIRHSGGWRSAKRFNYAPRCLALCILDIPAKGAKPFSRRVKQPRRTCCASADQRETQPMWCKAFRQAGALQRRLSPGGKRENILNQLGPD
jgi:hypothetical protein